MRSEVDDFAEKMETRLNQSLQQRIDTPLPLPTRRCGSVGCGVFNTDVKH